MVTITIEKFNEFINECVINESAILTTPISDNTSLNLFNKENLENVRGFLKEIKKQYYIKNTEARKKNNENHDTKEKIWGICDIFSGAVFDNLIKKEEWNQEVIIKILLHCNWLMYLCSERQHKQNIGDKNYYNDNLNDYYNSTTYWSIGQSFSGTSLDAMLFIVELLLKLKKHIQEEEIKAEEKIKAKIEELCNNTDWKNDLKWEENKAISSDAISNVLLFLCNPDYYLPIPAQNKKNSISKELDALMKSVEPNEQEKKFLDRMSNTDKSLYKIRKRIREIYGELAKNDKKEEPEKKEYERIASMLNPFWQPNIRPFWDSSAPDLKNEDISDEVLLEYKKAMVFYGPPGTSKSYQARKMAENLIAKAYQNNNNIEDCLTKIGVIFKEHIHKLQLHPNYTYDDFIVGKTINNNNVEVKNGFMLNLIDNINEDDKIPHIIILDEINRVDISRVFGELFTAMEPSYRKNGEGVKLSIKNNGNKDIFLKVPQNMYFIGTMNMIDFSLEQVDFALRRRFLWRLSTYDDKRLEEILSEKIEKRLFEISKENVSNEEKNKRIKFWNIFPDDFIDCCSKLNDIIKWESYLGKDYLIGHAYFTEIVDIFEKVYDWEKARNILWQISILPIIEAYCGNMDAKSKENFIEKSKVAFFPKTKQN